MKSIVGLTQKEMSSFQATKKKYERDEPGGYVFARNYFLYKYYPMVSEKIKARDSFGT